MISKVAGLVSGTDNLSGNIVALRTLAKDNKTSYWETFGNAWAEADFLKYFTARTKFGGTHHQLLFI